jgi:Holliday junction DNA helicase RuvA
MFNSIRGTITEKIEGSVFILSGGIEWDISVPLTDLAQLPQAGEEGRVFTWLYHREDQMKLYGFAAEERRAAFLELLKVEGIGPKGALKSLGGISHEELEKALEAAAWARLAAVPGLGQKTAQKLRLALKGKLVRSRPVSESHYTDLVEALAGMGYDRRAAAEALASAEKELPPAAQNDCGRGISGAEKEKLLFKQAIVRLSGLA